MMQRLGSLLAVLALLVGPAAAFYAGSDVVTLTEANFQSKIKSGGVWLVEVRGRRQENSLSNLIQEEQEQEQSSACALQSAVASTHFLSFNSIQKSHQQAALMHKQQHTEHQLLDTLSPLCPAARSSTLHGVGTVNP